MSKLVLYSNPQSRGLIAHWMIEEVGVDYELKIVSFDEREHKSPAFLALNPMGKVPTLVHGDLVVTEAAAICTYLADAFPDAGLAPALDDPARGTYLRWMFFGAGCVEPAAIDKMMDRLMPACESGASGYGTYETMLDTLETALQPGPWILGERFTAVDVYIGSQLGWGMRSGGIEPRDGFQAYVGRCAERPAFQKVFGG